MNQLCAIDRSKVRILIYDSDLNYKSVIDLSSYTFCSPRSVNYLNGEIFVKMNLSCRIADGRLLIFLFIRNSKLMRLLEADVDKGKCGQSEIFDSIENVKGIVLAKKWTKRSELIYSFSTSSNS